MAKINCRVKNEAGFSLIEILIGIFILSLVAGPLISLLAFAFQEYQMARNETQTIYILQGILETNLEHSAISTSTDGFVMHPEWPQYEYKVVVEPHIGIFLQKITVELRESSQPDQVISFTTLRAWRKINEKASY